MDLKDICLVETSHRDYSAVCFNLGVKSDYPHGCSYGRLASTIGARSGERLLRYFACNEHAYLVRVYSGQGFLEVPVGDLNSWSISHICDLVEANHRRSNFLTLRFKRDDMNHPSSVHVVRYGDLLVLGEAKVSRAMFSKFNTGHVEGRKLVACWDERNLKVA